MSEPLKRMATVALFGAAFGFVEAAVVVYLRALYYPGGFAFPLKMLGAQHLTVELVREVATLIMLAAVGMAAGGTRWSRFGFFALAFGVWDIFYYCFLKLILDWPQAITDPDILFLLPLPWIGPVIAPILISLALIGAGAGIVWQEAKGRPFRPGRLGWGLGLSGSGVLLYSFMADTAATLHGALPSPYRYELMIAGLVLYAAGFVRVEVTGLRGHSDS